MFERDGQIVRGTFFTLGGNACVYEAQSHQGVGVWDRGDAPYYCCGQALERVAGQVSPGLVDDLDSDVGGACPLQRQ
jgi:hypothetical protein